MNLYMYTFSNIVLVENVLLAHKIRALGLSKKAVNVIYNGSNYASIYVAGLVIKYMHIRS